MRVNQKHVIFSLFILISSSLFLSQNLPRYFSKQDPIDPEKIHEKFDPQAKQAIFDNKPLTIPSSNPPQVLGQTNSNSNKRIEVDLTKQRVYAYENDNLIQSYLVSTGTWDRTPTGTFTIWTKIRSQKMSGGSRALGTYYYLPNVPYIMFFYNKQVAKATGYSLHGTYWHNNFGVPMSHGCINMKTEEIAKLYAWAQVGTPVIIYGKYQTKLPQISLNLQSSTPITY